MEAIATASRVLTLKDQDGEFVTVDVPADVKRFPEIKVGDKVTATYYDNVTVRLKKRARPPSTRTRRRRPPGPDRGPAARWPPRHDDRRDRGDRHQGPLDHLPRAEGPKYSRKVLDKDVLKQVKVGDQVDFTWTEAVTIEVTAPKK